MTAVQNSCAAGPWGGEQTVEQRLRGRKWTRKKNIGRLGPSLYHVTTEFISVVRVCFVTYRYVLLIGKKKATQIIHFSCQFPTTKWRVHRGGSGFAIRMQPFPFRSIAVTARTLRTRHALIDNCKMVKKSPSVVYRQCDPKGHVILCMAVCVWWSAHMHAHLQLLFIFKWCVLFDVVRQCWLVT